MKPVKFKQQNCIYAEDQAEYMPLPAHRTKSGVVISCWAMSFRERLKVLLTGRVFLSLMTFNHPLQPERVDVDFPDFWEKEEKK